MTHQVTKTWDASVFPNEFKSWRVTVGGQCFNFADIPGLPVGDVLYETPEYRFRKTVGGVSVEFKGKREQSTSMPNRHERRKAKATAR